MKIALIGVGQAGGKIVDKFLEYEASTNTDFIVEPIAINTARSDLLGLERVPTNNRVLIGQAQVNGHGVGADNELGMEIFEEDIEEVTNAIGRAPAGELDAYLIVAALGGGTGSGGAPVVARHLRKLYTEPVYGLGVLPGTNEGGIYSLNAARSFQTFVSHVDNLLVFDNDAWRRTGQSIEQGYDEINEEIARRFGILFSAGEVGGNQVAESVVDSSEIINTLDSGGISTVGYATNELRSSNGTGLLSRFKNGGESDLDSSDATNRITSLIRKAVLGRLTLPADIESTQRALVIVSGPSSELNRKGIERGRQWLEQETGTMEVRGGDYPLDEPFVAADVLLSGVDDIPRIEKLQQMAIETQDNFEANRTESDEKLQDLIEDDDGELDPLF
jgi:cell division GTPase FtsZ